MNISEVLRTTCEMRMPLKCKIGAGLREVSTSFEGKSTYGYKILFMGINVRV